VTNAAVVTLEAVAKRYGWRGVWVLRDVDLELAPGSMTLLSGVNGSGKTSLLRIIAGGSRATSGVVRGARRVAVVPDRFVPPARMTGRSYLRHQGRLRGLPTAEANRRAEELGECLGVRPGLDVALQDLSKGNVQKVALAQAFLAPVDLLTLDEPRTAIDPQAVAALDDLLEGARRRGTTVVVTDPIPEAAYAGTRRYQLAAGHLRSLDGVGPPLCGQVTIRLLKPGRGVELTGAPLVALAETSSEEGDGVITLAVDAEHSDELLRRALGEGWSVLDVHRLSGAPMPRRSDEAGSLRP
jgi:ABC-type Mn2+/Zn2+ transport system ATPase subunit